MVCSIPSIHIPSGAAVAQACGLWAVAFLTAATTTRMDGEGISVRLFSDGTLSVALICARAHDLGASCACWNA